MKKTLQLGKSRIKVIKLSLLMTCLFLYSSLALLDAQTIYETMDALRDNTLYDNVPGHLSSWFDDGMPAGGGTGISMYTSQGGLRIVNYVGDCTSLWAAGEVKAGLKFTMPQTSSPLVSATLYLNVCDRNGPATATITLTDDNAWAEGPIDNSTFPYAINAVTLIEAQAVESNKWNAFSLPVDDIQTKISSLSANPVSLIVSGSTSIDTYFNFYSDNDANNNGGSPANNAYLVLVFRPLVQNVSVPANGTYHIGDELNFTVAFDSPVTVTGLPSLSLALNTGGSVSATYVSGSGSGNLVFRYTVVPGNVDADGITVGSLALNGGTIKNNDGIDASLILNDVDPTSNVLVDGIAPSVSNVFPPASSFYSIGQNLDYTVNFSEAVNVMTLSGTPYLTLKIGSSIVQAQYYAGSGSSALTFRYKVTSGDADADGVTLSSDITLNSGLITDMAGNTALVNFSGSTASNVRVDGVAPNINNVTGPSAGTYATGDVLEFTANFSENVTALGSPYILLTVGSSTRHAAYVSGSGTANLKFRYTLVMGDFDADGVTTTGSIILNSGIIQDATGNNSLLMFTAPTTTNVRVDCIPPSVSSVSPPVDGIYIAGQNLDYTVNLSEAVSVLSLGAEPYITLTIGSSTVYAAYYSGTGSSALTFRYTIVPGDVDANGVALSSNITLNSETKITDAAGNDAILSFTGSTATGVLVDAEAPTVTFTTALQSSDDENGQMIITAQLSKACINTVTVPFTVNTTGTAIGSGTDYSVTASPLIIAAGSTRADITIDIANDALDENNETVIIDMSTPVNANLGAITTHTATITDDDSAPTISFATTGSREPESVSNADIPVNLSSESGLAVTVDFTVSGTATGNGTDFTLANGSLVIDAGSTTNNISIADIVDDLLVEGDETVIVTLSDPVNATPGTNTIYTYTIADNDNTTNISDISEKVYSVYPNPFHDCIRLDNISKDVSVIVIKDLSGRIVFETNYEGEKEINVSHLKPGFYLLVFASSYGERQTVKILKEK